MPDPGMQENSSSSDSDQSHQTDKSKTWDAKIAQKRQRIVRRYDDSYLKYGFVCTTVSGEATD